MSQSKTIIQGIEPDNNRGGYSKAPESGPSFYSRSNTGRQPSRATIVPGMSGPADQPIAQAGQTMGMNTQQQQPRTTTNQGKPVVGFLYSISRTPAAEFWPLHIGPNTIGQDPSCDIVLQEATVSSRHAQIVVRQIKSTGQVIAAITDTMSTNGTMINGDTIGFTPNECRNGDVLTIGNNYELYLILIEAGKLGLKVAENFITPETDEDNYPTQGFSQRPPQGFTPPQESPMNWGGGRYGEPSQQQGTVGMDGHNVPKGGTIPL